MPFMPSFGTLEIAREALPVPKAESPFRIGILADFSGRLNRDVKETGEDLAARRMHRVSRDTLDEVMAKLGIELTLPVGDKGETVTLSFSALDDFHPDQVHDRVDQIVDVDDPEEKSTLMNSVLHHPDFQALESVWLGLDWLLGRAAKGGQVEVLLLDLSFAELETDLKAEEDLSASALYQILIDKWVRGSKGEPWAVLIGNYNFDITGEDAELLGRIAKIAAQTSAPFLTTVHSDVLDKAFTLSPAVAPAWQALRQLPEAALLGIAVPRFLLRLPYGENTKSIDKFSYEEMSQPPDPEGYLWGNPALLCAALLALAFQKEKWSFKPGTILSLANLPIHVFRVDGEEEVTLAEAWLVRPQTEQLVKLGIMPFLCVRGQGEMQVARFLSLAQPAKDQPASDLQGRWNPLAKAAPPPTASPEHKVGLVGDELPPPVPTRAAPAPIAPAAEEVAAEPEPPVSEPAAAETPAAEPETPPAEEEMDPDLAALLKQLE